MKECVLLVGGLFWITFSFAQTAANIPAIDAVLVKNETTSKIVEKEPKIHFISKEAKAFAVVNGTIRMVSNFNVVIEANGMYYIYQDVKGIPDQLNKEVKRGDEIGTMYFNDEKKTYNLYISVLKGPKQYLTRDEIIKAIQE